MSIRWPKGKQGVVRSYNGILFGNQKEGGMICATSWMNFSNLMLSERSQSQKMVWFHWYEFPQEINAQRQKVTWWLLRAGGRERIDHRGDKRSFWGDENVLYLDLGGSYMGVYACACMWWSILIQIIAFYSYFSVNFKKKLDVHWNSAVVPIALRKTHSPLKKCTVINFCSNSVKFWSCVNV